MIVQRTVIGSLPKLSDDLATSIKQAVKLQLKYRIHMISDGEQRYDMIEYFKQIPGIESSEKGVFIINKIRPPKNLEILYKMVDYLRTQKILNKLKAKADVKVSITGPITLGVTLAAKGLKHYRSILDETLYHDLSDALIPLTVELLRKDAFVQIDEPGVSAGFLGPSMAEAVLTQFTDSLHLSSTDFQKLSLHICGDLTRIHDLAETLERVRIPTLSLAFSGEREKNNYRLPLERILDSFQKKVGFGCIAVSPQSVDTVDGVTEIKKRIGDAKERLGDERIRYVHPDCGLRGTSLEVTESIFNNLMHATEGEL
ncbi:hypothetical protein [[Eubacterium] cellulosolvens]